MRDLPANRRDEIVAEIEEHISEGLAELPNETETEVRNMLERLGDPQDIAAEGRDRLGLQRAGEEPLGARTWLVGSGIALAGVGGMWILLSLRSPEAGRHGGLEFRPGWTDWVVDPWLVPYVAGALLMGLGIVLVVAGARLTPSTNPKTTKTLAALTAGSSRSC
jgi:hypothetical protein